MAHNAAVEQMLDADPVQLAGSIFGAVFEGVAAGGETASGKVRKQLRTRFGNPRWTDPGSEIYDAVALQTVLVWERALVAARRPSGSLILLPRGARLLAAPDPVAALREFL